MEGWLGGERGGRLGGLGGGGGGRGEEDPLVEEGDGKVFEAVGGEDSEYMRARIDQIEF